MYQFCKRMYLLLFWFFLAGGIQSASADEVILQLTMEENFPSGRTGPLRVKTVDGMTSPFGASGFGGFDSGLFVTASWNSICGTNVSIAGGEASGWLLGPFVDGSFPELDIDALHDGLRSGFGLGPGSVSNTLFAVADTGATGVPGAGSATRISCSGSRETATFAILYIFLFDNAQTVDGKGFYVGDLVYVTEIGSQLYFLYSGQKLIP